MKKLRLLITTISSFVVLATPLLAFSPAHASLFSNSTNQACQGVALNDSTTCSTSTADASSKVNKVLATALNLLSILVGIAAVIVIIVSGLRMILAQGDSNSINSARNGVLYAIVGLVIVALAQFIVRYVLERVG